MHAVAYSKYPAQFTSVMFVNILFTGASPYDRAPFVANKLLFALNIPRRMETRQPRVPTERTKTVNTLTVMFASILYAQLSRHKFRESVLWNRMSPMEQGMEVSDARQHLSALTNHPRAF